MTISAKGDAMAEKLSKDFSTMAGSVMRKREKGMPTKIPKIMGFLQIFTRAVFIFCRRSPACWFLPFKVSTSTEKMLYSGTEPIIIMGSMPTVP